VLDGHVGLVSYAHAMQTSTTPNILRLHDAEYNAIKAMNASGLKKFSVSPMHYKHWLDTKDSVDESGDSLRFGRALHCLCLEGDEAFFNKFAVTPVVDRRTKEGKLAWQNFIDTNGGKDFVTAEEFSNAQQMADRFRSNPYVKELFSAGVITEGVLLGEINGAQFKGRFDLYCPSAGIMLDIKTISKQATYRNIRRAIYDYDYMRQEAVYMSLANSGNIKVNKFVFSFMEKDCPHGIAHVSNDPSMMHNVYSELDALAHLYKQCVDSDTWPPAVFESAVLTIL
jgi:hypothetical protein